MQPAPANLHNPQQLPDRIQLDSQRPLTESSGFLPNPRKSSHPLLAIMYMVLKCATVAIFMLFSWFFNALTVAQLVIIIAAIDFWVTKNLAGRLLVGLRWWVDFDEQGEQHWKFECRVNENETNPVNDKIFWYSLAFFTAVWIVLSFINVLRLDVQNVTVCGFCAVLLGFNLYWFYKCSKVQKQNVQRLAAQYGRDMMTRFFQGSIVANFI